MRDSTFTAIYRHLATRRGRELLHRYQDALLRRQLDYAAQKSPFYRQKFQRLGLNQKVVRRVADLPALGFFTFPAELRADPSSFLAIPRQEAVAAITSSGTTGKAKIVYFSRSDWAAIQGSISVGLSIMGVQSTDVAQILFAYGNPSWPTGHLTQNGLARLGVLSLAAGNALSVDRQIEMMQTFGTTLLFSTPSYLHRLTVEARKQYDLPSLGVRLIRLGSEPWSEALRTFLQESWGAQVYDAYGMIELGVAAAGECRALAGLHVSPYVLVEVVDPTTGAVLPCGELGELVYTTVNRQATPLLRYRSGDLGRLLPDEVCPCGQVPTDRISRIAGRTDDMLILGTGENTFPAQFQTALTPIEALTGFQVIIDKVGYQDQLRVRVEIAGSSAGLDQRIRERLYESLAFLHHDICQSGVIAPLEIEFLTPGTLQSETPTKIRMVVDRRPR
ncbi:MAG TPA: AMP-binding protein [Anaerolineae bacterium]|nr:AMP-binding protein [Anaerolineae bacterium]